jgi:hypothetical protein
MAHVRIGDRDASVFGDAALDAHATPTGVRLEVLADDAIEQGQGLLERGLGEMVGQVAILSGAT